MIHAAYRLNHVTYPSPVSRDGKGPRCGRSKLEAHTKYGGRTDHHGWCVEMFNARCDRHDDDESTAAKISQYPVESRAVVGAIPASEHPIESGDPRANVDPVPRSSAHQGVAHLADKTSPNVVFLRRQL